MSSLKEFYKSAHPDYFSDSEMEETSELDRSLLEYHLSTLTSRSQEADFERFARRLCEKEVCPNLLPTTGPTGGGDSKADSETFPVAESLSLKWYIGEAKEASQERWAFAFSAKSEWRSKVQSDVKKIAETGRGYKKAFFVTNQSIPAKKRAEVEDSLTKEHGVDVRILDRNWVLERVFTGRHEEIAVSELKVTALKKQAVKTGPLDSARITEMEMLEKRIADAVESKRFGSALVDDAIDVAAASRALEKPKTEIEGSYARADRLATKYGTLRQQVESAYQWAWTLIWWFDDWESLPSQYQVVEERAKGSDNVYDIERLSNLLTILTSHIARQEDAALQAWLDERTAVLRFELARLADDEDRPSVSLHAKTLLLQNKLIECIVSNADPSGVFEEMKGVVESAEGLVGFPLDPLVRSVTIVGSKIQDSASYDALFEAVVEVSSKRDGEVRAARLLLMRGGHFMDQGKPAKAIAIIGQALSRLYKHETRTEIVYALYLCAYAYERLGLLWAARGTYLSGASIAANDFWLYGEISRGFRECIHGVKRIELSLGRLPHILAWHEVDLAVRSRMVDETINSEQDDWDASMEMLLARLIVRLPPERYSALGPLVHSLDELELHVAASVLLFLLGHPERMDELASGSGEDPNLIANNIWGLQADVPLPDVPDLYDGGSIWLSTKILGCKITVESSIEMPCTEVAESILAALESLLSTSALNRAFAYEPEMTMEVVIRNPRSAFVSIREEERIGKSHLIVECQALDPQGISGKDKTKLRSEIFEAALITLAHVVRFRDFERDIESLFREERVSDRASAFTGSVGTLRNVLGNSPKFQLEQWLRPKTPDYSMKRVEPWRPSQSEGVYEPAPEIKPSMAPGDSEPPAGLLDRDGIPHDQMDIVSPIRHRLWDRAGWTGALYMWDESNESAPIMGLMFRDRDAGSAIFTNWLPELGKVDEKKALGLTVVRGIDKRHPHAYRIVIRGNLDATADKNRLIMFMQRIHRMDAVTSANLDNFLKAYEIHQRFVMVPAFMEKDIPEPNFDLAIGLLEIRVRNAWEIGLNDLDGAGVQADDDVIIPEGTVDPPVRKLQEWKRSHEESE